MNDNLKSEAMGTSVPVLANAIALGARVIFEIGGNDISNTVGNKLATMAYLHDAFAARLQANFSHLTGAR